MADLRVFPLEAIRTDGWFQRIGQGVGSFQALCDIIGARFFAFAMITGARITSLTVDRRQPDNTVVEFVVGGNDADLNELCTQQLTLGDFRRRLVAALLADEPVAPAPERPTDLEALQLHIGVRYLLLAPLYGYALQQLRVQESRSELGLLHDGVEESVELEEFHGRIRAHVLDELRRVADPTQRAAIDLGRVAQAERALADRNYIKVLELLGAWPAPLAIFLRTPQGQLLNPETRQVIARGLGLLGTACIALDEVDKGEEVLRLAVQYARDGSAAADIFSRLGQSMLGSARPGEAIAPLRRAANLGADGTVIWPMLADALLARGHYLAAYGALEEARECGVDEVVLGRARGAIESRLGAPFLAWQEFVAKDAPD
jgi:tetratricopeptide (TPR) repeat protein